MSIRVCQDKETLLSNQFQLLDLLKGKKGSKMQQITVLTNITNAGGLLASRVKHGSDNQKACHDATFTHSEN